MFLRGLFIWKPDWPTYRDSLVREISLCSYFYSKNYCVFMHLSILIPGGKGAGNEWGFDKKLKNWVKCPLVGHSKLIKCFKTDAPRG
jgi:hypothetical protein